jgi:4'-phosphopantetheinyl transferase
MPVGCPTCAEPHGKPRLRGRYRLEFSVAHTADLLVFAFQAATSVGVDVEALAGHGWQPPPELLELALTPAERRRLDQVPASDQWRAFLRYWTRKEAVLKQLGIGLSAPLHDVAVDPAGPDGRINLRVDGWAGAQVWASGFELGATHVGAVATAGQAPELRIAEVPATVVAAIERRGGAAMLPQPSSGSPSSSRPAWA